MKIKVSREEIAKIASEIHGKLAYVNLGYDSFTLEGEEVMDATKSPMCHYHNHKECNGNSCNCFCHQDICVPGVPSKPKIERLRAPLSSSEENHVLTIYLKLNEVIDHLNNQ